mgnify:FL=1
MLMFKAEGGFHNFADHEVDAAKKDGWVDGEPVRAEILRKKGQPEQKSVTIEAQSSKRTGRPRKELPSFLTGATNGNSSDAD